MSPQDGALPNAYGHTVISDENAYGHTVCSDENAPAYGHTVSQCTTVPGTPDIRAFCLRSFYSIFKMNLFIVLYKFLYAKLCV